MLSVKKNPDICIASESQTVPDIFDSEMSIKGYQIIRTDSYSNRTGGVITYIRNKLNVKNIKRDANKFIWINSFELNSTKNRLIKIAAIYMSASESKLDILNYFDNWCDEFCNDGDVIICGDFNINVAKKTTYSERLLNTCNDYGLKQLVKNTTRFTNHSATIIDLCFSNLAANVNVSNDDKISDHYNIDITIPVSTIL
jgi:exonuclease III